VSFGWLSAAHYLQKCDDPAPDPPRIQVVHRLVFGEVHPWAGRFRRPGELVVVSGRVGADPQNIMREVQLLCAQSRAFGRELRAIDLDDLQRACLQAGFDHMRLTRIHPFKDGNGRTSRLIATARVRGVLKSFAMDWELCRPDYIAALKAGDGGDLAPMANLLLRGACSPPLPPRPWPAPFRIAPDFDLRPGATLADDLLRSRRPKGFDP
jgi:fido (protein-threonine AMPylation protein)